MVGLLVGNNPGLKRPYALHQESNSGKVEQYGDATYSARSARIRRRAALSSNNAAFDRVVINRATHALLIRKAASGSARE
jgi:hypothetical protein